MAPWGGEVWSRWGGQKQSHGGSRRGAGGLRRPAGQRARASQQCAVKVRRRLRWKAQAAPVSSGKNGKSLAGSSHDRKHKLPYCAWWKKRASVNHIMQRERLPACLMVILIPECYMLSGKPIELHVSCIFAFVLPHCAFCTINELLLKCKNDSSCW